MDKKYAIIIGVGPGLGLALAKRFQKKGFNICMVARNIGKLESFAEQMSNRKGKAYCYGADAGDHESLESTLKSILKEHGTPDVLIYNVSLLRPARPTDVSYGSFVEDFKINVGGLLTAYQTVFPSMKKDSKGMILVTGGGLSLSPFFEFTSLGVGKAGLRNLAGSLAQEAKKSGIKVYTITVNGMIERKTKFDPELIAENFFKVYQNGLKPGEYEIIYR